MRPLGILLLIIAVVVPAPYYVQLIPDNNAGALLSMYLGSVSLILMGISQLMSTRFPGVQLLFGGLDRVYWLHKWIGIIAIIAMMLHDVIDAETTIVGAETWLMDIAEESGEIALYGLLGLVLVSLITFVPYELWKKTHKFIGALFALSAFHFFFIPKPFANTDVLGLYINAFCLMGIVSYVYMLLLHGVFDRTAKYKVSRLSVHEGVTELNLSPVKSGIKHKAGQFAFLKAGKEKHPFTIASAPKNDQSLRFCIKGLGNFSASLPSTLQEGDTVQVSRAFGHFKLPKAKKQVWVAGGIGITPFLAWLESLDDNNDRDIHLVYCLRSANEPVPFQQELNKHGVTVHIVNSKQGDRLTYESLKALIGDDLNKARISYCGPKPLRLELQKHLKVSFEEFEMRSGIKLEVLWVFSVRLIGKLIQLIARLTGSKRSSAS